MLSSSQMQIDPPMEDCYSLRGWYDSEGTTVDFVSKTVIGISGPSSIGFKRTEARSLNEIKESELGMGDKPDFFSCRGTIVHIREDNLFYPACTGQNCNKKMTNEGDSWICDKCGNRAEAPEYRYANSHVEADRCVSIMRSRYIVSLAIADWSGQAWLQVFNDAGIVVFGMSANELQELRVRIISDYHHYHIKGVPRCRTRTNIKP